MPADIDHRSRGRLHTRMTDGNTHESDWIAAWIARQRELLAESAQSDAMHEEVQDLARRWAEAGQAFFDGLRQFAFMSAAGPHGLPFDPFNIGNTMLDAWSNATLFQSSLAEQASEVLKRLPPIGIAREHTEAWRELTEAQAECKRLERELRAELTKVQMSALDLLEKRVRERDPEKRIESFRELYDLWVDCGEQAYGSLAHSPAYAQLQAELINAHMRLRSRAHVVVEYGLKHLDLPTRSELNSVHRQLRELREQVEALSSRQAKPKSKAKRPARKSSKRKARSR
jgi:class III poly(R)-hydroxyalkanoic acid synthase PhaE subunit